MVSQIETILIASERYPAALVKSKFLKLNYMHIDYVISCMKKNTTKVKNIKKYLLAVLMREYLQSMKANLRDIIQYIDESTLEKAKNEKVQKQESPSKVSKDVEESVDKMISNRMSKAYSEWKSNQDTQPYNENIEKEYQKLLETLFPEQEEVLTKYYDEIFASGAESEEFFYRLGIKDGLRLKSTIKSVLEMME